MISECLPLPPSVAIVLVVIRYQRVPLLPSLCIVDQYVPKTILQETSNNGWVVFILSDTFFLFSLSSVSNVLVIFTKFSQLHPVFFQVIID